MCSYVPDTFLYDVPFLRYRSAKLPLIFGAPRTFAIFWLPLRRRFIRYTFHIWQLGRSNGGIGPTVTSDDLDLLLWHWHTLKENFQYQDFGAGFLWDTSGPHDPTLAFRSTANLSIASYSWRAKGVPSYWRPFSYNLPFWDIDVQTSPLILASLRTFAIFLAAITASAHQIVFGSLVGLMEALHQNNFGWPWPSFVTVTHI